LIQCFGISKQAFYKRLRSLHAQNRKEHIVRKMVLEKRQEIGHRTGGLKLYELLKEVMRQQGIKMGRDKFYHFLRSHNLLVAKTKKHHITTYSKHRFFKYRNLVKDKVPTRPEQLWVSDITYIKTEKGHAYLALVTDAYSKQIMGYKIANHMKTSLCIDALRIALKNRQFKNQKIIHHSDRGIQYCNPEYTAFAEENGLIMSMTQQSDPYENAVAERINQTLKYEYGLKRTIKNLKLARKMLRSAVEIYNQKRPHFSLQLKTPKQVHLKGDLPYRSYKMNQQKLELLTI
jgi:putative transposase